jgi:hypothetical protein
MLCGHQVICMTKYAVVVYLHRLLCVSCVFCARKIFVVLCDLMNVSTD